MCKLNAKNDPSIRGTQPYSIAFGGVFPYITEAILNDENSTKSQNLPPKTANLTPKLMNFY